MSVISIAQKRRGKFGESVYSGRSRVVLERSWIQFKSSTWIVVLSGFMEPLLNLVVFGYGVGAFVGNIELADGRSVSYAAFVVPGLLASAAMMGAVMDATWNVDRKSTRLNSSHSQQSRMPSSA